MEEEVRESGIEVGTVVADTYEVVRQLGRGGMGAVWEAHHKRLPGKKVAIKVLHGDVAGDRESLARFKREAEIASRLGHPNIVEVHDFNSLPSGAPYLVLEYLEGESLDSRLESGRIPLEEALSIVRQVGSALRAAHREEVVHRDLKPQNVFMARSGDEAEVAKVLDFGISKIRGSQTVKTQESSMLGTPQYMSPEQATGNHAAVDARTDVFALGAMVYEMLCGRPAFSGETIPEVVFKVVYEDPEPLSEQAAGLPERVTEAVERALAKKQDDRFPDVESFVEALTGEPLATLRGRSPAPSGAVRAKARGADALAATADSGERPQALGTAETIDSGSRPVSELEGVGPTVGASGERAARPAPAPSADSVAAAASSERRLVESAATQMAASQSAPAERATPAETAAEPAAEPASGGTEHIRRPKKSPANGVVLALVAAGLGAAVAVALVTRPWEGGESARAGGAVAKDAAPAEAEPQENAPAPAATEDGQEEGEEEREEEETEEAGEAAEESEAKEKEREGSQERAGGRERRESGAREKRAGSDEGSLPKEVEEDLQAASKALRSGAYDRAIRLATRAERKKPTTRGYSIKARAYCAKYDLSNARANWRNLPPRAQKRVARFCADYDIHL